MSKTTMDLSDFMRVMSRQKCLEKNTEGCLHRHHNEDFSYGHLFNETIRDQMEHVISNLSRLLKNRQFRDCTTNFDTALLNPTTT